MATRRDARRSQATVRVAAVELGNATVRAVEVEVGAGGARLLKRGSAPLPADCWEDIAASRGAIVQAIRAALAGAGISTTQVAASIPRRVVTLKYARLPHAEADQVRGMVQYEAQQYIPFPIDDVVLDHEIVSDETDEMTTAMIVAARRSLVDEVLAIFDSAGVEITRLTVSSLGLAEHAHDDPLPVALLEVQPGSMDLAVVSDGRMIYSRSAFWSPNGTSVAGHALASEVARSLAAYKSEYRTRPVSSLQLAASSGEVAGIVASLEELLEIPVARAHSPLLSPADPESLSYATAIGVAASSDGGPNRLNLVPISRFERKQAARRRVQSFAGLAVVTVVAIAGIWYGSRTLTEQRVERARTLKANQSAQAAEKAYNSAKAENDRLAKTAKTVSTGLARSLPIVDVVKSVSDAVPKTGGINLTQLTVERGGQVALHGNARTESATTDLVLALQGSGAFTDVKLGYLGDAQAETVGTTTTTPAAAASATAAAPKAKPGDVMTFVITCKIKGDRYASLDPANAEKAVKKTGPAAPAGSNINVGDEAAK